MSFLVFVWRRTDLAVNAEYPPISSVIYGYQGEQTWTNIAITIGRKRFTAMAGQH
jgi:hypothetical protein